MTRIEKLEAALSDAKHAESEARACGFVFTRVGIVFAAEARAIRIGVEKTLDSAILAELAI